MILENITAVKILEVLLTPSLRIVLVIVIALIANKFAFIMIKKITEQFLKKRATDDLDIDGTSGKRIETLKKVFGSIFSTVIWILAVLTLLPVFGINIAPILAGLGVGGLALGLAAQTMIKDYISGIFILLEDHYRVGEKVELAGKKGIVEDFNLRRTVLKTQENAIIYIPNSSIVISSNLKQQK